MTKPATTKTKTTASRSIKGATAAVVAMKEPEVHSDSDDDSQDSIVVDTAADIAASKSSSKKQNDKKATASMSTADSNIIYVGHLPRHFQEHELLVLLKQFGSVLHVRLSRSKKTNGSRGYAFVQFADASVATIVANTLSGYLLDGKRLVCHVVAPDKIHKNMVHTFLPSRKTKPVRKERSLEKIQAISKRLLQRQDQRKQKLAAMGIEYEFDGYTDATAGGVSADGNSKQQSATAKEKKRKDSVDSVASESTTKSKNKKRKTSVDSAAPVEVEQKVETFASLTKKEKKRKDSVDSAVSDKSESKRRRKESIDSTSSIPKTIAKDSSATKKDRNRKELSVEPATPERRKSSRTSNREAESKQAPQSERKIAKPANKSKSRRKST